MSREASHDLSRVLPNAALTGGSPLEGSDCLSTIQPGLSIPLPEQ